MYLYLDNIAVLHYITRQTELKSDVYASAVPLKLVMIVIHIAQEVRSNKRTCSSMKESSDDIQEGERQSSDGLMYEEGRAVQDMEVANIQDVVFSDLQPNICKW